MLARERIVKHNLCWFRRQSLIVVDDRFSKMVRSNSETPLPPNLLPLAERFRQAEKYFDVSLVEIERRLDGDGGEYECRAEVEVAGVDGVPVAAELRLNITCKSSIWANWSVSIKLHKVRIDGIDYEPRFPMGGGKFGAGWHRHSWDETASDCDNKQAGKIPLDSFADHCQSRASFLIFALKELRVLLNKNDHGTDELSFC